jgi:hypothetical protein
VREREKRQGALREDKMNEWQKKTADSNDRVPEE